MSQVKLAAAKELIIEKKYVEARAVLLTIKDDPTAAKWLRQLDERIQRTQPSAIYPVDEPPQSAAQSTIPAPPSQNYTVVSERRQRRPRVVDDYDDLEPMPNAPVENLGMAGCFRWVWGILVIASLLWLGYGCFASANISTSMVANSPFPNSSASDLQAQQGAGFIGAFTLFFCTGVPLLVLFGLLYWRNGVAIRETKKHNQMIAAIQRRR